MCTMTVVSEIYGAIWNFRLRALNFGIEFMQAGVER